jgi:hypothetical protein
MQCDGELSAGAHVQAQALLGHPASDLGTQEGLGRVVHPLGSAEGGGMLCATSAEIRLVHHEQRSAIGLSELADLHTGQPHRAIVTAVRSTRPHRWMQRVQLGGAGRARARGG